MMIPPFGKSGAGTIAIRSSRVAFGFRSRKIAALTTSRMLWGGMFVAIPTAIPEAPFTNRFGNAAGRTSGSDSCAS